MEEVSPVATAAPESVGETLRAAREQQGLSLGEVANRTRVPLRHLEAIETGNYNGLPSHTYATGFVRAYARAVGVDEVALARRLRGELAHSGPRTSEYQPYEAPDPARVPSRGLALAAFGVGIVLILLIGLWYGGLLSRGAPMATTPAIVAAVPGGPAPVAAPTPAAPTPAAPTGEQVALQVTDRVWMRVHDGDKTLYSGTMSPGERFDVPADAQNPLIDVGRPDKLKVTLNGSTLPPLAASSRPVTNLRIGAAAVAARLQGGIAPTAGTTAGPNAPNASAAPRSTSATAIERPRTADDAPLASPDAVAEPAPAGNAQ